ncbi:equilibrative nucleoside transporter [Planoprotostelium fungivorum]|uniref:Equilibrative nucleoside transporter n=1 Tax=Planoprotostelium fungivorum TaxID=1890364 RepID=A0A2P6P001_9EUKA|nr:equilibrative nucleoside transporter [Planoprotostelium fungivorum]
MQSHEESGSVYLLQKPNRLQDDYGLVYMCFTMLGVGALLPWNTFLAPSDYYSALYPNSPFYFLMSMAYNSTGIIALLLSIKFGQRLSFGVRIVPVLIIELLVLASVPLLTHFVPHKLSMWLVLALVFVTGFISAILFSSVVGLASLFPPQYVGAVMTGNGIAGIVTAGLRIITKVSLSTTENSMEISGGIYFGIAAAVQILVLLSYFLLVRRPFAVFCLATSGNSKENHVGYVPVVSSPPSRVPSYAGIQQEEKRGVRSPPENESMPLFQSRPSSIATVMGKVWPQALNAFFVFFVTLSVFPGVSNEIKPHEKEGPNWYPEWFQIILITLFMIFDFIGRALPRWFRFPSKYLWVLVLSRFVFFALFLLMVLGGPIIQSDPSAFVVMSLLAISNGYCGSLSMMYGPQYVDPHEKERAGAVMSFALNLGIFVAICFSTLPLYLIKGSLRSIVFGG